MALSVWLGFLLASILIAISPGPGAATSMSIGLRYGYGSAARAILGLQTALVIQLAIVAAGLGVLLATSAPAFDAVKFLGAGYLVWLGIQKWRATPEAVDAKTLPAIPKGLFRQGLLVNLSNPKSIVFITALTPQFIDPARPQGIQFLILGMTLCGVDSVVMSGYALLATHLRHWLHDTRAQKAQNRFFGGVFIGAGVLLATSGRN